MSQVKFKNNRNSLKEMLVTMQQLFSNEELVLTICKVKELPKFHLAEQMISQALQYILIGNEKLALILYARILLIFKSIEKRHKLKFLNIESQLI